MVKRKHKQQQSKHYPYDADGAKVVLDSIQDKDHVSVYDTKTKQLLKKLRTKKQFMRMMEEHPGRYELWVGQAGTPSSSLAGLRSRLGRFAKMSREELEACDDLVVVCDKDGNVQDHVPKLPVKHAHIVLAVFWGFSIMTGKGKKKGQRSSISKGKTLPQDAFFGRLSDEQCIKLVDESTKKVLEIAAEMQPRRECSLFRVATDEKGSDTVPFGDVLSTLEESHGKTQVYLGQEKFFTNTESIKLLKERMKELGTLSAEQLVESSLTARVGKQEPGFEVPLRLVWPVLAQFENFRILAVDGTLPEPSSENNGVSSVKRLEGEIQDEDDDEDEDEVEEEEEQTQRVSITTTLEHVGAGLPPTRLPRKAKKRQNETRLVYTIEGDEDDEEEAYNENCAAAVIQKERMSQRKTKRRRSNAAPRTKQPKRKGGRPRKVPRQDEQENQQQEHIADDHKSSNMEEEKPKDDQPQPVDVAQDDVDIGDAEKAITDKQTEQQENVASDVVVEVQEPPSTKRRRGRARREKNNLVIDDDVQVQPMPKRGCPPTSSSSSSNAKNAITTTKGKRGKKNKKAVDEDDDEVIKADPNDDDDFVMEAAPSRPVKLTRSGRHEAHRMNLDTITTSRHSALCDVDLTDLVNLESFVEILSPEARANLYMLLPEIDQSERGLVQMFNSPHLKESLRVFQKALGDGILDPYYQSKLLARKRKRVASPSSSSPSGKTEDPNDGYIQPFDQATKEVRQQFLDLDKTNMANQGVKMELRRIKLRALEEEKRLGLISKIEYETKRASLVEERNECKENGKAMKIHGKTNEEEENLHESISSDNNKKGQVDEGKAMGFDQTNEGEKVEPSTADVTKHMEETKDEDAAPKPEEKKQKNGEEITKGNDFVSGTEATKPKLEDERISKCVQETKSEVVASFESQAMKDPIDIVEMEAKKVSTMEEEEGSATKTEENSTTTPVKKKEKKELTIEEAKEESPASDPQSQQDEQEQLNENVALNVTDDQKLMNLTGEQGVKNDSEMYSTDSAVKKVDTVVEAAVKDMTLEV